MAENDRVKGLKNCLKVKDHGGKILTVGWKFFQAVGILSGGIKLTGTGAFSSRYNFFWPKRWTVPRLRLHHVGFHNLVRVPTFYSRSRISLSRFEHRISFSDIME